MIIQLYTVQHTQCFTISPDKNLLITSINSNRNNSKNISYVILSKILYILMW